MAQATTVTPLDHLVKVLKLGEPSAYRNHTYINGESMYFPTGRVYGGQVIAQSVIAASKTVGPSRLPHSVHGYFIAAGDIRQDLLFDVENLRDGRSFSARRVNVTQAEGSILTAIASFQARVNPSHWGFVTGRPSAPSRRARVSARGRSPLAVGAGFAAGAGRGATGTAGRGTFPAPEGACANAGRVSRLRRSARFIMTGPPRGSTRVCRSRAGRRDRSRQRFRRRLETD